MSVWHEVLPSKVYLCLGARTACAACQGLACVQQKSGCPDIPSHNCSGGHCSKPIFLEDGAPPPPKTAQQLCPENMESLAYAKLKVLHYPSESLGAGSLGPLSIEQIMQWCMDIRSMLAGDQPVAVFCSKFSYAAANTVLLLGSYLALELGLSIHEIKKHMPSSSLQLQFPLPWTKMPQQHAHSLTVKDCLCGLIGARRLGWIDYPMFNLQEWRSTLKTYDASTVFEIHGASAKVKVVAMADPVTTVADSSVRPVPPTIGFVDDYEAVEMKRLDHKLFFSNPLSPTSSSTQGDFVRAISGEPPSSPCDDMPDFDFCRSITEEPCAIKPYSERPDYDITIEIDSPESPRAASPTVASRRQERRKAKLKKIKEKELSAGVSKNNEEQPADCLGNEAKTNSSGPSMTWLERTRIRHWGLHQHEKQSSVPFAVVKERGLVTMPEVGAWLQSIRCKRLVRLNFPDEKNLPRGESYGDYFNAWKVPQSALQFLDGTAPPADIVQEFCVLVKAVLAELDSDEDSSGSIVVHCTAGLGRTATLLGALAMTMCDISGGAWLGWIRMYRPGSVQTLQQERFLKTFSVATQQPNCCVVA